MIRYTQVALNQRTSRVKAGPADLCDRLNDVGGSALGVPPEIDHLPAAGRSPQIAVFVCRFTNWTEMKISTVPFDPQSGCGNTEIESRDKASGVVSDHILRHKCGNLGVIKQATKQFFEPRVGQGAFCTPPAEGLPQYTGSRLTGPVKTDRGLLQPQRVDPMNAASRDQRPPDVIAGMTRAKIGESSGQRGARQATAFESITGIEDCGLMDDDPVGRCLEDTARTKHSDFCSGRTETVEREQSRRGTLADERASGARCGHDRQPLLPRRRVSAEDEQTACGLAEPATFLCEPNIAGREPERGGLASRDKTMARGRELRHGLRGRSGHSWETIGVLPSVHAGRRSAPFQRDLCALE